MAPVPLNRHSLIPNNESELNQRAMKMKEPIPPQVIIHPLVLLNVADHFARVAKDTKKRVVGVLLGEWNKQGVDVLNSYAIPFEEDPKDASVWYIDKQYHEEMFAMFKKVNAREKVIGWYSTGPKIRACDLDITELFRDYTTQPVLVIVGVNQSENSTEIPVESYVSVEVEPEQDLIATSQKESILKTKRQFLHLPSKVEALEAEDVGVEHLLRGIRDVSASTLSDKLRAKVNSLRGLKHRLLDIVKYLELVEDGTLHTNHNIMYKIQDMLNMLPDLRVNKQSIEALAISTNDNYMVMYLSSIIRAITALHDVITNKMLNSTLEKEDLQKEKEKRRKMREELRLKASTEHKE